ncbi:MAG: hypothetical protein HUU54_01880 [Ignavibacteriaceae bacterium]|nr:hypothetical protein [Ignavibacteriaceae bacterium]
MKIFQYLLIFSLLLFVSCDEESTTGSGDPAGVTAISGKLENYTLGSGKIVKLGWYNGPSSFDEVSRATIGSDGSFSLQLNVPQSFMLDSLISQRGGCTGNMTSTTPGVMVAGFQNLFIYEGSQIRGVALLINRNISGDSLYLPALNDALLQLVYFDKATTINGSETCPEDWDRNGSEEMMVTRAVNNVKVTAGWNKIYSTITARTSTTATYSTTTTEPSGLKWYYISFN